MPTSEPDQPTPASIHRAPHDPWPHEVGEDLDHVLDATGHHPHQKGAPPANVLSMKILPAKGWRRWFRR